MKTIILIIAILIFPELVFANNTDVNANRQDLIVSLNTLVQYIAILIGLLLMVSGAVKLKARTEQPNNPTTTPAVIITSFLAGALLFNYSSSVSTMLASLLGNEYEYCMVLGEAEESYTPSNNNECWDASSSELTAKLRTKIENISDSTVSEDFAKTVNIVVGFFQLIGFIYFIKGAYGLKLVSSGTEKGGYGKPIITMIASALIIDLPHTAEIVIDTVNRIGVNF